MLSLGNHNNSHTIEYEEFLKMMTHKILNRDPKDEILKAFRVFDDDETGKISFKNLKRVAKELGERMTDEELQEMIDEADRDGDGEVNAEEFLRIMKKTNLFWLPQLIFAFQFGILSMPHREVVHNWISCCTLQC